MKQPVPGSCPAVARQAYRWALVLVTHTSGCGQAPRRGNHSAFAVCHATGQAGYPSV